RVRSCCLWSSSRDSWRFAGRPVLTSPWSRCFTCCSAAGTSASIPAKTTLRSGRTLH
ncbi:hypothetical protein M9458_020943, partial [Cirrhinus mrigala]